jgi:hypothetical protein
MAATNASKAHNSGTQSVPIAAQQVETPLTGGDLNFTRSEWFVIASGLAQAGAYAATNLHWGQMIGYNRICTRIANGLGIPELMLNVTTSTGESPPGVAKARSNNA